MDWVRGTKECGLTAFGDMEEKRRGDKYSTLLSGTIHTYCQSRTTFSRPSARKLAVSIVRKFQPRYAAMDVHIVVFAVPGHNARL